MANYTQTGRRLSLETSLGQDVLIATSFAGREEISRLSVFQIQMVSETADIDPTSIVGKNVTLNVPLPDGTDRYFNGFVTRFACRGSDDRLTHYRAEIVPWLWFLTRTTNCRIFQNQTAVDIIKAVFAALKFTDFETSHIQAPHVQREYCVQYRESDFNFVSRLMEEEGIYYYFKHEEKKHTLVLSDCTGGYHDCKEADVTFSNNLSGPDPLELISAWEHRYEFRSGQYTQRDYNFETPSNDLTTSEKTVSPWDTIGNYELYDYPGGYSKKPDGTNSAKLRMEEQEIACEVVSGASRCRSFEPGGKFKLTHHHLEGEENKGYVITAIEHTVTVSGSYESGSEAGEIDYRNTFECIPESIGFRPARTTPKPFIRGVQTAVVVGPSGQEIYVDQYGRIKVQFFWDRDGKRDEKSSCWVRVSQISAGSKFGAFFWPRISQEVVVTFLEGDPDRPLVTGTVYNAEKMPHYALPDQKTKSGIKTNSSPGGGGFNELRFEDKKGKEQVFIHAQRNLDIKVKSTAHETVNGERHLLVGGDHLEKVGSVDKPATKHLVVTHDFLQDVKNEYGLNIQGDQIVHVVNNQTQFVGGKQTETVIGDQEECVTGKSCFHGDSDRIEAITGKLSTVAQEMHLQAGSAYAVGAGSIYLNAKSICIEAGTTLTLKVGGNFVAIDSTGVSVKGTLINLNSGGSPGSGSGPTPDSWGVIPCKRPDPPKEAAASDDDTAGSVDKQDAVTKVTSTTTAPDKIKPAPTREAAALKSAAVAGTPFCAMCAFASAVLG